MRVSFFTKFMTTSLVAGTAFAWAITPSSAQLIPSRAVIVDGQTTQIVEQVQERRAARRAARRTARRAARRTVRQELRADRRVERRVERRALRRDLRADRHFHRRHFKRHHRRFHDDDDVFFSFGLAAPFVAAPFVAAPYYDPYAYAAAPVVVGGCGSAVVVQPGDTLAEIAARCGTTVTALVLANPEIVNPNVIHVGQVIDIP